MLLFDFLSKTWDSKYQCSTTIAGRAGQTSARKQVPAAFHIKRAHRLSTIMKDLPTARAVISEKDFPQELLAKIDEKWSAFLTSCGQAGLGAPDDADLVAAAKRVFGFSDFVARQCIRHPETLHGLLKTGDLLKAYDDEGFTKRLEAQPLTEESPRDLSRVLREVRSREMTRIAFRDLAGWAELSETINDLSAFADACIEFALSRLYLWLCREHGTPEGKTGNPQSLVVIGLGKLGGRELNFSSDIDLMFAYSEPGLTRGAEPSISNAEFFSALCRRLIEVLGKPLPEGIVFRVDTRLRPLGDAGPIVMSFDEMESYYQLQGREWERYALIKARIVAGDKAAGEALIHRLQPFVYRRYLDYGSFESLRGMKRKIEREVVRKGMAENIKMGPGGIREIEFFGQVFQLIRGGINPDYQERGIQRVLSLLVRDRCIPDPVGLGLAQAYVFLRNVENRLQMADDLQTHTLPKDPLDRSGLALSMGFKDWERFAEALQDHMRRVHSHFDELLAGDGSNGKENDRKGWSQAVWQDLSNAQKNLQLLEAAGFAHPAEVLAVLKDFLEVRRSADTGEEARKRIDRLVPKILEASVSSGSPTEVLKRVLEIVKSTHRRSCYLALLMENSGALAHLIKFADASPWIISYLSRHPLLLDELLDPRDLYSPLNKEELKKDLSERLKRIPPSNLEARMDSLRVFKQVHLFKIVAADVGGVLPLMKVSDRLTYLAETILDQTLELSWDQLVERYGKPLGLSPGEKGFAVIAYGKLGGIELGYGSDLDLVFLYAGENRLTAGGRMPPIDNAQFYMRLGQRIIHFLTMMTQTGKLYETDMRLRPSGNAGILVSPVDGFEEYQMDKAWTWEHQAIIKARPVSGDASVGDRFLRIRERVLSLARNEATLKEEVVGMRKRMRREQGRAGSGGFDLKQDSGGIIDIEFLVQFLILKNANQNPALTRWTDVVRQLHTLALSGIIDDWTAHTLKQAYLVFRYYTHRLALQEKPAVLPANRFAGLRERVKQIWNFYLA